MAQEIEIIHPLTAVIVTELKLNVTAAQVIVDALKISLTPKQIKQLLKVGINREALIKALYTQIMLLFPATMPTGITPADFALITQEENDSIALAAYYTGLATILTGHAKILNNNRMFIANATVGNATQMGKTDPVLNTAVKDFKKEFYTKTPAKPAAAYKVPVSGVFELGGVLTGKVFVNTGEGMLSFLNVNGDVTKTIKVNPGSSAVIPKKWTSIIVTNLSATNIGTFNVFIK